MSKLAYTQKVNYSDLSTTELVILCQQTNELAFTELLKRHQGFITARLKRLAPDFSDHSDLIQEVNIRVWRFVGQLRKPSAFLSWLGQLIRNVFNDELRKRPRDFHIVSLDEPVSFNESSEETTRDIRDVSRQPEETALAAELSLVLNNAMAELPVKFQRAQKLRDVDGLSYEEIAQITNAELGTVKSRIARARLRIQAQISDYVQAA